MRPVSEVMESRSNALLVRLRPHSLLHFLLGLLEVHFDSSTGTQPALDAGMHATTLAYFWSVTAGSAPSKARSRWSPAMNPFAAM